MANTSKRVLFLSPSDAYVRSFLYFLYPLIKLYYEKALSNFVSDPRLNSSLEAKNPGIFLCVVNHLSVGLFLVFKVTSILFSIVAAPVYIPTNSVGGFSFLHILFSTYCCRLSDDGHSDWCEVKPQCSFCFKNNFFSL